MKRAHTARAGVIRVNSKECNMKRTIIVIAALLLCGLMAYSQPDFSALKYGVRAGIGIGSVDYKYEDDDPETMGGFQFHGAIFAELPVWNFLSVTTEIQLEHTGISDRIKKMEIVGPGMASATIFTETYTKFPLNYINIPILAKARFLEDLLYVEAGPQVGFLVGKVNTHTESEVTTKYTVGGSDTVTNKGDTDDTDHFKKGHFAFALGWGFMINNLEFGTRVGIGISDLQAPDYKVDGVHVGHTDIQVAVRYYF